MSNPRDLYLQLLSEALWVERTLAFQVLPELIREADSELLAQPLNAHLQETSGHAARVEAAFLAAGVEPTAAASDVLQGLHKQHDQHVGEAAEPRLRDLFLIDCAARTEVVEAALYTSAIALAGALDLDASGLEENRSEEDAALQSLDHARGQLLERLG